jgi:hypothetical protein
MDESGSTREVHEPAPGRGFARSWPFRITLVLILINAVAIPALAVRGHGRAKPSSCAFSGYSGGGGGDCSADLALLLLDQPDPVAVAGRLFYLAQVTNNGPDEVFSMDLTIDLPPGIQVDWVLPSNSTYYFSPCSVQGNHIFCTFYDLQQYEQFAVAIVVRPPLPKTITAKATVTSSTNDPNLRNNNAKATTTVTP